MKAADLYDHRHPYFAEDSPFKLNSTDEEVLEVTEKYDIPEESTLSLIEIKWWMRLFTIINLNLKLHKMGNKILGRRSRSFYKGFNERQVDYLKQKFETISTDGKVDKKKFM